MFLDKKRQKGFGLIETVVAIAIFLVVSLSIFQVITGLMKGIQVSHVRTIATSLANEQLEIIRNLQYEDVGIIDGIPAGRISREKNVTRSGIAFLVTTSIRDVDQEFDGTIDGTPQDLSPADNKLVSVTVSCVEECSTEPVEITSFIAPKGLEITGNNGALFVNVFDASGVPVNGATVSIQNSYGSTTVDIDELTGVDGIFKIVNAATGTELYAISATKTNYSTDQTYAQGDIANPAPYNVHATVLSGQVTEVSFSIDELSDLQIESKDTACNPVAGINFDITGAKEVGVNTRKYTQSHATNGFGELSLANMEWDTYDFDVTDSVYDLAGSNTTMPLTVLPGTTHAIDLIMEPKDPNALLVLVRDGVTGLPLSDVDVTLERTGFTSTKVTGRGFLTQSDWSGGSGQDNFVLEDGYFADDGNIETISPVGEIKLNEFSGSHASNGELESSVFDTGTTTNFYALTWEPTSQPAATGLDSVKFQVATNDENTATTTWSYIGPDGTDTTYFTTPGEALDSSHNGDQYFRYKAYLETETSTTTPSISDVSFVFTTDCIPSGQTFYNGLVSNDYEITIEKAAYETYYNPSFSINEEWQMLEVTLNPS